MSGAKNLPDLMVLHCDKIIAKMEGRTDTTPPSGTPAKGCQHTPESI